MRNVAHQLVAGVVRSSRSPAGSLVEVSSRNACSSPAPAISMSRASRKRVQQRADRGVGVGAASARRPRRGARRASTPGSARAGRASAPGSVARIVRVPTIALISVVGPSATTRPRGHQHGAVGVGVGLLEVVGREDDVLPAGRELAHRRPERRGGPRRPWPTVGSSSTSSSGSLTEREREAHALRLAAGQLLRPPLGDRLDADEAEHLLDARAEPGRARRPSSTSSRTVQVADQRRRSAASRRPRRRASRSARRAAEHATPCPRPARVRPSSMSIVVDLPAPFGPSSATISPARSRCRRRAPRRPRRSVCGSSSPGRGARLLGGCRPDASCRA